MSLMVLENGARWSVDEGWDDDGVIQYDLCDDVLELLDVPFWRRQLSFFIRPLKIVYPPWKNENTRSRPCGIDS